MLEKEFEELRMKKILITGKNSYIGNNLIAWLEKSPHDYEIDTITVKDDAWKGRSFAEYDSIVHVAGLAHVSTDPEMEAQYYKVNRDLTIEVAQKAKAEKVPQFIFLSSIIVYGDGTVDAKRITRDTPPNPSNFYGDSKLQAEQGLKELESEDFKIAIIRPPMIYGKNSKGNYPLLAKFAKLIPIFPRYNNQRSMLYVHNLTELIRLLIDDQAEGMFYPQNTEYVQTSELVELIRKAHSKRTLTTPLFNWLIKPLVKRMTIVNKVFGDLTYDLSISDYPTNYRVYTLEESIKVTEE